MRKLLLAIILSLSFFKTIADEGMWLPILLGQQVYNDMVKKGLKLTRDQLYHINKPSIKDAIILFNGDCTGQIVSNEGLIFTSHQCGYNSIAGISSIANNYLKTGFWAKTKLEEIPSPGLYVEFLLRIDDVTKEIDSVVKDLTGNERVNKLNTVINSVNQKYSDNSKNIFARVSPVFKANQFLIFIYQRYNDVRLAATPPESIARFGGDTDAWEWPRHSGDFSIFRVYMNKEGQSATYSAENIPLKPKYVLPVSLKGIKEGDYTMVFGYPDSSSRYETSMAVKLKTDIINPAIVKLSELRLRYMLSEMKKDAAIKLNLSDRYIPTVTRWKFFDGETKQLLKNNSYDQRKSVEATFNKWAQDKPEFSGVLNDWTKVYDTWKPLSKHQVYIKEGILGSPLMQYAASLLQVEIAIVKQGSSAGIKKALDVAKEARAAFLKTENKISDQSILAAVLQAFYQDIDKNQHPIGFYEAMKGSFGDPKEEASYKKYTTHVFNNSMIFNDGKWNAFVANPDANVLQADPAFAAASAFIKNWQSKYFLQSQQFNNRNADLGRIYMKGFLLMDTVKAKKLYPDASSSMRISFGNVKSYQPRAAVKYDYVTTMKGVIEKNKPGDYEFDLPSQLIEAAQKKDYGQYIDKLRNDLVIAFITTNDITDGNSGSPVLDASGNLIGLCLDVNAEALGHNFAYDKDLNRTICVDIRYVLWCIEKIGGATNLIRELKLVK